MGWRQWLTLGCLGTYLLAGCATMSEEQSIAAEKTLYERLGGKAVIIAVVGDFTARVRVDPRLSRFFQNPDLAPFKTKLVNQICAVSGGSCTYNGRDMRTIHQGMGIANPDFEALLHDLVITLDKFKVPEREKSELLALLGPMRKDIVTR